MKAIIFIQLLSGMALGSAGVMLDDVGMIVVGCMLIICGKLDYINQKKG